MRDIIITPKKIKDAQKNQAAQVEMKFYRAIKDAADRWEFRNLSLEQMQELAAAAIMQVVQL